MQTLVVALGAGLGIWGVINLLEGYGQDNPASKSQGMKQLDVYKRQLLQEAIKLRILELAAERGYSVNKLAERSGIAPSALKKTVKPYATGKTKKQKRNLVHSGLVANANLDQVKELLCMK